MRGVEKHFGRRDVLGRLQSVPFDPTERDTTCFASTLDSCVSWKYQKASVRYRLVGKDLDLPDRMIEMEVHRFRLAGTNNL